MSQPIYKSLCSDLFSVGLISGTVDAEKIAAVIHDIASDLSAGKVSVRVVSGNWEAGEPGSPAVGVGLLIGPGTA